MKHPQIRLGDVRDLRTQQNVLNGVWAFFLEGWHPQVEDKQVPGVYK